MTTPSFKVRTRVLNQLGDQLIKNESIALLELIKNKDADELPETNEQTGRRKIWCAATPLETVEWITPSRDPQVLQ